MSCQLVSSAAYWTNGTTHALCHTGAARRQTVPYGGTGVVAAARVPVNRKVY